MSVLSQDLVLTYKVQLIQHNQIQSIQSTDRPTNPNHNQFEFLAIQIYQQCKLNNSHSVFNVAAAFLSVSCIPTFIFICTFCVSFRVSMLPVFFGELAPQLYSLEILSILLAHLFIVCYILMKRIFNSKDEINDLRSSINIKI